MISNETITLKNILPLGERAKLLSEINTKTFNADDNIPIEILNNLDKLPSNNQIISLKLIDMKPTSFKNKDGSIRYSYHYINKNGNENDPRLRELMSETPIRDE